ncbi:RNA 3'-terminal phosphate cyclase [Candidatus Woesearchaeota archaeon]|nr:RNA 3'-terminal phosphate cyclase [Candidatus Woesearchaeota archaeon]
MIELDGSYGSGGGALVRVALALSALTGKEFKVDKIRAGKGDSGGLKAQHLHAIKALKEICGAETNEIELGSKELWFKPGKVKRGIYEVDIGTAGSISLFLQALILPCMFAPGKVTLKVKGGTCGKWQAPVDYLQNVLLPQLRRFVEKIELKVLKRGYYPKGGGEVVLEITPKFGSFEELSEVPKFSLGESGKLEQIKGRVNLSRELEEKKVGERIKETAERELNKYSCLVDIAVEYSETLSVGGEVVLWAVFSEDGERKTILGGDDLIEKGKRSEDIGKEAAEMLIKEIDSGFGVDRNLADQLIMFMALLPGSSMGVREVSKHSKTNVYVVEKFLDVVFEVDEQRVSIK